MSVCILISINEEIDFVHQKLTYIFNLSLFGRKKWIEIVQTGDAYIATRTNNGLAINCRKFHSCVKIIFQEPCTCNNILS